MQITGTNKQTVKNVTRLGNKNVDSEIPSPMRVIFEDEKAKGSLMANMKNLLDIFMTKFNEANNKYIPHMNTKASNKAKKHNYIPLDAKTVQKI